MVLGPTLAAIIALASGRSEGESASPKWTPSALTVGDIMGRTQLRHFKLWYAGHLENWQLANYEVDQIKRSFDQAASLDSPVEGVPFSQLIEQRSLPPLADVKAAIAAQDEKAFAKAFDELTLACNNCHIAAKVGFIKMQVPTASPFSNQAFPP